MWGFNFQYEGPSLKTQTTQHVNDGSNQSGKIMLVRDFVLWITEQIIANIIISIYIMIQWTYVMYIEYA